MFAYLQYLIIYCLEALQCSENQLFRTLNVTNIGNKVTFIGLNITKIGRKCHEYRVERSHF